MSKNEKRKAGKRKRRDDCFVMAKNVAHNIDGIFQRVLLGVVLKKKRYLTLLSVTTCYKAVGRRARQPSP